MAVTKSWNDAVGGREADLAPEVGPGEVEDRAGQVGLVDQVGVVDERADPAREPDPAPVVGCGRPRATRSRTSSGRRASRSCREEAQPPRGSGR